jgi:hypothetical protein
MVALVQSASAALGKGTTMTVTLGSAPTAGNLLVYIFGITANNTPDSVANGGAAYVLSNLLAWGPGSIIDFRAYVSIANGSENTAQVVTFPFNAVGVGAVLEFDPEAFTWLASGSVTEAVTENDVGTSETVLTCPAHSSPGNEAVLQVAAFQKISTGATFSTPINSFIEEIDVQNSTSTTMCVEYKLDDTPPIDGAQAGITSGSADAYGAMHLLFATEVAAAGGIEVLRLRADGKY